MRAKLGGVLFDRRIVMESPAEPPPLPESLPISPTYRFARLGMVLALIAITACVVLVVLTLPGKKETAAATVKPNRIMELTSRYLVGMKSLMQGTGQWDAALTETLLKDIQTLAHTDEDTLRLLILKGWMRETWPSEDEFSAIAKNDGLRVDVAALGQLKTSQGMLTEDAWKKLHQRHGWIAELARAQASGKEDARRQVIMQQSLRTMAVMVGVTLLGLLASVGGIVLMVIGIKQWRSGQLRLTLQARSRLEGGVLIEGFAIFLGLYLLIPTLLHLLEIRLPRWSLMGPALLALLIGLVWPLLRGMKRPEWRKTVGLHGGAGVWREMGAGVLGWLAALPLLALGIIAASWIAKLTGDFPSHPIVDEFSGDIWTKLGAVMLAVVWAPVAEELMFRGLLFPGLVAWLRWLLGVVMTAFIFAVIHPQGWAGVPAIMALATAFSILRMWRQSLIAPMTAHALNNGIICTMMLLM